jgi:hypothetical protein
MLFNLLQTGFMSKDRFTVKAVQKCLYCIEQGIV